MKVLIPFSYYHPEQCAGLFVIDDMTEVAAREGIESLITVPSPTRNVPADAKWERNEKRTADARSPECEPREEGSTSNANRS